MSLLRSVAAQIFGQASRMIRPQHRAISHLVFHHDSYQDITNRYECFFCRQDIDGWDVRQAMNDLAGMDLIPDPRVIIAAMYACRRINEYALAVRFLETIKYKCGPEVDKIYPYILQEIAPTLCELGVDTPEALGYDKPELFLEACDNIH